MQIITIKLETIGLASQIQPEQKSSRYLQYNLAVQQQPLPQRKHASIAIHQQTIGTQDSVTSVWKSTISRGLFKIQMKMIMIMMNMKIIFGLTFSKTDYYYCQCVTHTLNHKYKLE